MGFLFYSISETRVKQGKLLTTIPRLSTEWSWSFDYRTFGTIGYWGVILHCDSRNGVDGFGFRIPAIALVLGSGHELAIGSAVGSNSDYSIRMGHSSDFNKTNHLEIHQRYISGGNYRYFVIHNGQEVHSKIHNNAIQFYNVKCWTYPPLHTSVIPSDVYISNVIFTNFL